MLRKKQVLKFKSLLVSSSILALTIASTNSNVAYATTRESLNNPSTLSINTDWNPNGPFVNGDSIKFGGNHAIVMNTNNRIIDKFDTTGQGTVGNIEISNNCFLGDITGTGGSTTIKYLANRNVRLNKSDYSKLAGVDFNGQNGQLWLTVAGTKFNSSIISAGELGRIRIDAANIEITSDLSGANIRLLDIRNNDSATLNTGGELKGRSITIRPGGTLTTKTNLNLSKDINLFNSTGGTLIVEDGVDIKARNIRARDIGVIVGLVKFNKAATVESKFGDTNRTIANIEIGAGPVSINTDIYNVQNTKFTDAAGSLIMNKNQAFNFTNTTLSSTAGNDAGTLVFDTGNTTTIGATFSNVAGQKVNKLVVKNNSKITIDTEIHLGDKLDLENGGKLDVNDGKNINARDISPVVANIGEINFLGASNVNTNIGEDFSAKEVKISTKEINFVGQIFKSQNTILSNVNSAIKFAKNAIVNVNTKFGSGGAGDSGKVIVDNNNSVIFDGEFSNAVNDKIAEFIVKSNSSATINTDLNLAATNDITIEKNATLIVGKDKNIVAQGIVGGGGGTGKLIYLGNSKVPYELDSKFEQIEIRDGQVDFEGSKIEATTLDFTSQNATIRLGNTNPQIDIVSDIRNISGSNNAGNIIIDTKLNLTGKLGEAANRLNSINFAGDHEFISALTTLHVNKITTDVSGTGRIILTSKDPNKEFSSDIGTSTNKLKLLEFVAGLKVKANKMIHANTVFLKSQAGPPDQRATLTIEDNVTIDAKIITDNAGAVPGDSTGILIVEKGATLTQDVGEDAQNKRLSLVNFASNDKSDVINVLGNIYADNITINNPVVFLGSNASMNTQNNINFNNATLVFSNGSNLTGNNTITDSVINLNDNGGGFTGATQINNSVFNLNSNTLNFTNAGTSSISGSPTFNINIDENNNIGHILVNGGNLDTTGVTQNTLTLTLSDLTTKLPAGSVVGIPTSADQYVLFATINGGSVQILNDSKVLFDLSLANNPFVTWTYSNGVLTQIANEPADIDAALQAIINANTEEPVSTATTENLTALSELIADPNNNSQLAQDIVTIAITEPERLDALVSSFQPSDAGASVAEAPPKGMVVQHSLEEIGRRLSNLTLPGAAIVDNDIIEEIGLSAGDGIDGDYSDKPEKHGIWASPFYNIAKHKQKKSEPGYKLRASGINLGYELMVNEDLSVGFSAGSIQSTIKHTDVNAGDITKSNIYVFSVHGAYELGNNWFTQGFLAYSRNKTKNRELRIIPRGIELATAKYNSNNYSSEFLLGYHHRWQESTIFTTFLGAEYHYLGEVKYTETGTTAQNLLVKRKADNDLELIAGERISYETVLNEYKVIPYLQGYVRYELINKRGKMNICLNDVNVNLSSRSAEFDRVHYNLGTGVSLQKGNMEYGASYDLYLAEKYVAHHGSLKLRIKF